MPSTRRHARASGMLRAPQYAMITVSPACWKPIRTALGPLSVASPRPSARRRVAAHLCSTPPAIHGTATSDGRPGSRAAALVVRTATTAHARADLKQPALHPVEDARTRPAGQGSGAVLRHAGIGVQGRGRRAVSRLARASSSTSDRCGAGRRPVGRAPVRRGTAAIGSVADVGRPRSAGQGAPGSSSEAAKAPWRRRGRPRVYDVQEQPPRWPCLPTGTPCARRAARRHPTRRAPRLTWTRGIENGDVSVDLRPLQPRAPAQHRGQARLAPGGDGRAGPAAPGQSPGGGRAPAASSRAGRSGST